MYPASDYEILLHGEHRTRQLRDEAARRRLLREARQQQPRAPRTGDRLTFWLGQQLVSTGARLQARAGSVPRSHVWQAGQEWPFTHP